MDTELETLATALYVKVDDAFKNNPGLAPTRPVVGIPPSLSDAELVTLCVLQAFGGWDSDTRFLRHARVHLIGAFPYLPKQPGYNKRLRKAIPQLKAMIRLLASDTDLYLDNLWLIDSTPVECGRSRPTAKRSDVAGFASYGYCASHSRYFWGLRLHLICTPSGLPIAFALANAKADEREVARDMFEIDPHLLASRPGQMLMGDKGYASGEFETFLNEHGVVFIRPARSNEKPRPHSRFLKPLRQLIESVNDTLKGQLNLEHHGGRTDEGVFARVLQRLLALTAGIWHNFHTGQAPLRSLIAYDHG